MKKTTSIGLFTGLVGLIGIVVSQTVPFSKTVHEPGNEFAMGMSYQVEDKEKKNTVLYCGIVVLLVGGGIALYTNGKKKQ